MNPIYERDGAEEFWLGPSDDKEDRYLVYQMQSTEGDWFQVKDGTRLDPNYSEFSVRIHNPSARSLSFINKTIAILPKSQVRAIKNLLEAYLAEIDEKKV